MSIWLPRRDKDGRWSMTSISIPLTFIWLLLVLIVLLIVFFGDWLSRLF